MLFSFEARLCSFLAPLWPLPVPVAICVGEGKPHLPKRPSGGRFTCGISLLASATVAAADVADVFDTVAVVGCCCWVK